MMLKLRTGARSEYLEAFAWYEGQRPGLGLEFEAEFENLIERATQTPKRFAPFVSEIRKGRVARFPYFVYFAELGGRIEILAIIHCKRNPAWIMKRLQR